MKFRDKFLDIITYHADDGTSGYELSNEQIEETIAAVKQLVKEAKPKSLRAVKNVAVSKYTSSYYNDALDKYEENILAALGEKGEEEFTDKDWENKEVNEAVRAHRKKKYGVDLTGVIEGDSELSSD